VLAAYLHQFDPVIVHIGRFGLRWYGLAYVVAFVLGFYLYRWLSEHKYNDLTPEEVPDFITWAAVFGVMLGGRLGHVIFYAWDQTLADPMSALRVWEGGMSSHGGILGLVLFTLYYALRHRKSWTSIGDSLVVVAPIGLFLVRCANFINGELYGKPTSKDAWWAVQFPLELDSAELNNPEVRQHLRELLTPRHPSQIYEALLEGVLLFIILWIVRTRLKVPRGVLTGLFFILYAAFRIIGEIFREPDPHWSVGIFSAGQFLSLFMPLLGLAFIVWGFQKRQYEAAFKEPAPATAP
jgi:phosphatidylglycerol:prolipoprotein diacylglycerol transferase